MTRALVTGGAGFVGAHLCRLLSSEGVQVTAFDNLSSGYASNLPDDIELVEGDLTNAPDLGLLEGPFETVFHLASHVGQELSFERPAFDLSNNAIGTANLLSWCLASGNSRVIFASTMNVYGDPQDPTRPVQEDDELQPPSPYAVAKIASEQLLDVYRPLGISGASLRLFNTYGTLQDLTNMKQGMVSIFMRYVADGEPILVRGSGDRFRDFVSVHDVVSAFQALAQTGVEGTYNVSTGRKTTVDELLQEIIVAFGYEPGDYPVEYAEGTVRDQFGLVGDNSRLRSLGWEARVSLPEGVREMAEWVRESQSQ